MTDRRPQDLVREFHKQFGLGHPTSPLSELPEDTHYLRTQLHREESEELQEAYEQADLTALIKEACDLAYVAIGTLVECGVDFEAAFAAVHKANMSKLPLCEHCGGTGSLRINSRQPQCTFCYGSGLGPPITREDGKILKSERYNPPDMTPFVGPRATTTPER